MEAQAAKRRSSGATAAPRGTSQWAPSSHTLLWYSEYRPGCSSSDPTFTSSSVPGGATASRRAAALVRHTKYLQAGRGDSKKKRGSSLGMMK